MKFVPLDLKLGFRMLVKYPGLTIVGGLAMAFAIWVGAVTFEVATLFTNPSLPLPGGDRIVQVLNWDAAESQAQPKAIRDFVTWRTSLTSVKEVGAWRDISPRLRLASGDAREVVGAEISASAFRIAPTRPLLGRVIAASDEQPGAPAVVLLGNELWRSRFDADPAIVGRSVQLGESFATVIGVMPAGFAFPVSHDLWIPFRPAHYEQAPGAGPAVTIFGQLAPGVSLAAAQVELALYGERAAAENPQVYQHLEPRVRPFASVYHEPSNADLVVMLSVHGFAIMLMLLVCSNVALLMFARAATRENELVVRSALGASRRRIIAQFFGEAIVLGGIAGVIGLGAAAIALEHWGTRFLELNLGRLPFWYDVRLSPATVLYAIGLTLVGAAVAGIVPALKATHNLGARLRAGSAGAGGLKFGGVWTAVIIAQVAVTVAFPAVVFVQQRELLRVRSFNVGFSAERFLAVRLDLDPNEIPPGDSVSSDGRFGAALENVRRGVAAEPGVEGVTFINQLPRFAAWERYIELEDVAAAGVAPEVTIATIDPSYFDVLESPVLAGRGFNSADVPTGNDSPRVAIVDKGFVKQTLQGANPIGRRVRFQAEEGAASGLREPWFEIVGVVPDLGLGYVTHERRTGGMYLPRALAGPGPMYMMVHRRGDPMAVAPAIRDLVSKADPALRVSDIQRVDQVTDGLQWLIWMWIRITLVLTAIALVLSLAGIYAVLSFTVARRTREIGVRVALGASRQRVVAEIFRRPLTQVGYGVLAGAALVGIGGMVLSSGGIALTHLLLLTCYTLLMLLVCLLACILPTRRALRVEPTEALRGD